MRKRERPQRTPVSEREVPQPPTKRQKKEKRKKYKYRKVLSIEENDKPGKIEVRD